MADQPVSRTEDLPDGDVVVWWTFFPTLIGAALFALAVWLFVL